MAPKVQRPGPERVSVTGTATAEEERAFLRAIIAGLADLEAGRELSLAEAKARLRLT